MIADRCQRWRDRRSLWATGPTIDPSDFEVRIAPSADAKAFVHDHHYSGTYPATRLAVGLYRRRGGSPRLAGVAAFSVPINERSIAKTAGLDVPSRGVDLGRFVLLDDVAANGESWFLRRALKSLRREKPEVEAVISYADPVEIRDSAGEIVKPGHIGGVYRILGARYRGRSTPRRLDILPDGRVFSARAASKIRGNESGRDYAIAQLVDAGAPPPQSDAAAWLDGLKRAGFFRSRKHSGAHTYCWPLTLAARLAGRGLPDLPYPVIDRHRSDDDVTALPLFISET